MLKSHQARVDTLTNKNAKVLAASIKAFEGSEKTVCEMTVKVEKLLVEVMKFMADF